MKKANNPQNLKPFKKGQSGNPSGRPKKLPDLDELLTDVLSEQLQGKEALKVVLLALRKKAATGDVRACELLLDRAYGKLKVTKDIDINFDRLTDEDIDKIIEKLSNNEKHE